MLRTRTTTSCIIMLTLVLAACGKNSTPDSSSTETVTTAASTLKHSIILKVSVDADTTERDLKRSYPGSKLLTLQGPAGFALLAVNEYTPSGRILSAEPNTVLQAGVVNSEGVSVWAGGVSVWAGGFNTWAGNTTSLAYNTFTDNQPYWSTVRLGTAHNLAPELGAGVKVAVIDSGIDIRHPAFTGRLDLQNAFDYVGWDTYPQEINASSTGYSAGYGHGTAVAGIIAQVAPRATILPLRVLNAYGQGNLDNVIYAINRAISSGAHVINLSVGAGADSAALNSIIDTASRYNVTIVTSSGNSGDTNITFPARRARDTNATGYGLVSVGSVTTSLTKSSFSTFGSALELTAPGEGIRTTFPGGQLTFARGTSFAAPIVSGAFALARSVSSNHSWYLQRDMLATATPNNDSHYAGSLGAGTINVGRFINLYR